MRVSKSRVVLLLMLGQAACAKVAGFEEFTYSDGGSSETASEASSAYSIDAAESGSCEGGADEASAMAAALGMACGFIMPNPAGADLPNPASYTPNGDGTVTDNVTGLTWEGIGDASSYTQSQAVEWCEKKGGGWRLPTRIELTSLVDYTIAPPGPTINAIFARTYPEKYWTSTHAVCDPHTAWYVGFDTGRTRQVAVLPTEINKVRCVRGSGSRCSPNRYLDQADGTVRDGVTGLTWQRAVPPLPVGSVGWNWGDAKRFCAGLPGTGWRLPSVTELETIMDDTKQDPSIDGNAFPYTPVSWFWTSSPLAGSADRAFYATTKHGHADTDLIINEYLVRCVR